MAQKTITMRAREVHTSHFDDYLGKRHPVELHMSAFSHDGIEYECGPDGMFEAHEAQVPLLEAHGFERVPDKMKGSDVPPKFILGPDGKFMSRQKAADMEAELLQLAAKKAAEKAASEKQPTR